MSCHEQRGKAANKRFTQGGKTSLTISCSCAKLINTKPLNSIVDRIRTKKTKFRYIFSSRFSLTTKKIPKTKKNSRTITVQIKNSGDRLSLQLSAFNFLSLISECYLPSRSRSISTAIVFSLKSESSLKSGHLI